MFMGFVVTALTTVKCFIFNTECYDLVILIIGSAACPKEGTTNLHLDMSDAVNIMVSSHIVLSISNSVRGQAG